MNASTHDQPRYYGSLFNLEHRVMSGAVLTLAAIVLVLFGEEGRAVQAGLAPRDSGSQSPGRRAGRMGEAGRDPRSRARGEPPDSG